MLKLEVSWSNKIKWRMKVTQRTRKRWIGRVLSKSRSSPLTPLCPNSHPVLFSTFKTFIYIFPLRYSNSGCSQYSCFRNCITIEFQYHETRQIAALKLNYRSKLIGWLPVCRLYTHCCFICPALPGLRGFHTYSLPLPVHPHQNWNRGVSGP